MPIRHSVIICCGWSKCTKVMYLVEVRGNSGICLFGKVCNRFVKVYYTMFNVGGGNDFFLWGGGQNVDMPSDCQNVGGGGTGISIPLRQKSRAPGM